MSDLVPAYLLEGYYALFPSPTPSTPLCGTFWGSHGCDLPKGHDSEQEHPVHMCATPALDDDGDLKHMDICSQAQYVDEEHSRMRYMEWDEDGSDRWGEWSTYEMPLFT